MTIELGDVKRMRDFSEKVSVEEQGRGIEMTFYKNFRWEGRKGQSQESFVVLVCGKMCITWDLFLSFLGVQLSGISYIRIVVGWLLLSISRTFFILQKTLYTLNQNSPFFLPLASGSTILLSVSELDYINKYLLEQNHTLFALLTYFT